MAAVFAPLGERRFACRFNDFGEIISFKKPKPIRCSAYFFGLGLLFFNDLMNCAQRKGSMNVHAGLK